MKGDSHQIWRIQRVQVNVACLGSFLRSSTGPNRAFEPQSLGRVRDHLGSPKGRTRLTQQRNAAISASVCGWLTSCSQSVGERKGPPTLWYLGNLDGPQCRLQDNTRPRGRKNRPAIGGRCYLRSCTRLTNLTSLPDSLRYRYSAIGGLIRTPQGQTEFQVNLSTCSAGPRRCYATRAYVNSKWVSHGATPWHTTPSHASPLNTS